MKKTLLILAFISPASQAVAADDYRMKTPPDAVQLLTPYGEKTIVFDNPEGERPRTYRLQIPISDLKPPETAKAEPPAPAPVAVVAPPAREPSMVAPPAPPEPDQAEKPKEPEKKEEAPAIAKYDDSDSLILEANRLFNRGDYFTATTRIDELLRRNPSFTRAWIMKGTLLYVQGFKDLAKNAWEKAYSLSENNTEVKKLLEKVK